MPNLDNFRKLVHELYRTSQPYDDARHPTQADLAWAIGLNPTELSNRLNANKGAKLTSRDARAIVFTLTEWGALRTQAQAQELLSLAGYPTFSASELAAPPLDLLIPLDTPVPSVAEQRHNLPATPTSFIGREQELATCKQLLADNHLLTITGTGGSGKTRLALELATQLAAGIHLGVWLVELAEISTPLLVEKAVADALLVSPNPGEPLRAAIRRHLGKEQVLLVLDNCEHLIAATAELVAELISWCPKLTVVATSREPLRIAGEVCFALPPLRLPTATTELTPANITEYAAVELFVARAKAALPGFALTAENTASIADVCVRLDGLPLALELAAARVSTMSVTELAQQLDNRFKLLTNGLRTAEPRQQTLKALIDWSYDQLAVAEQRLLRQLSVFRGGFTWAAVAAVAGEEASYLVTALVEKSLLLRDEQQGISRYHMLETIREYADMLLVGDERQAAQARHAAWVLSLVEQEQGSAERSIWLARLGEELANIRAALSYTVSNASAGELGLRMVAALRPFWKLRGYHSEGRSIISKLLQDADSLELALVVKALLAGGELALDQADYAVATLLSSRALSIERELGDTRGIATALSHLGGIAYNQGQYELAVSYYHECLTLRRQLADQNGVASTLNNLGAIASVQGNYELARQHYEMSLAIREALGDKVVVASTLNNLGNLAIDQGDYSAAEQFYERALALHRELGDQQGIAQGIYCLGLVAHARGDQALAKQRYEESIARWRVLGNQQSLAYSLSSLGELATKQGDYLAARELEAEALSIRHQLSDKRGMVYSFERVAILSVAKGWFTRAASLFAAAEHLRAEIGSPLPPTDFSDYPWARAELSRNLSPYELARHWNEGLAWPWEQAYTQAMVMLTLSPPNTP